MTTFEILIFLVFPFICAPYVIFDHILTVYNREYIKDDWNNKLELKFSTYYLLVVTFLSFIPLFSWTIFGLFLARRIVWTIHYIVRGFDIDNRMNRLLRGEE